MDFEWDDTKNVINQIKHNLSFSEAMEIFDGIVMTSIDDRMDYGEIREISIGAIKNVIVVVVAHTQRGKINRIISARRATPKERKRYYEYLQRTLG